jgi:endonuclease III related protein
MPEKKLVRIYNALYTSFGPQYWWPGETQFEVAVGAILTQNTNWGNVEKAVKNLKARRLLRPSALHNLPHENLAELLRPAGYFNIKAKRLKNFVGFLMENYQGSMKLMKKEPLEAIRNKLLEVNGIGPETADSIILYALEKPVFVIDAYTKRVLSRHNILGPDEPYDFYQDLFHSNLKKNIRLFNEYHALIVKLAKENCRTRPLCSGCPLEGM